MGKIMDLYDNFIKAPTKQEIEAEGHMCYLAYVTPYLSTIVEYAGRTCYKSFDKMTENSHEKLISAIVKSGHESVIEHTNLVYIIFKKTNEKKGKDSDEINRHLIDVLMYNGLLTCSETTAYFIISGNIRMFKDLVRKYFELKKLNNKTNPIIDDIRESFYGLPKYFFIDMIDEYKAYMDENKFSIHPKIKESTTSMEMNKLNDYVSIINHDYFSMKIKGFIVKTEQGSTVKRVSLPISVLEKHNRLTVLIRAPRYITHQLVRHRLASYSQASQRYIKEGGCDVYTPESFNTKNVTAIADACVKNSFNVYSSLLDMGVLKEDARAVLPNSTMSTIVMTATIEEFKHFFYWRSDNAAQNFIRDIISRPLEEYVNKYYQADDAAFRVKVKSANMEASADKYKKKQAQKNNNASKQNKKSNNNNSGKKQNNQNNNKSRNNNQGSNNNRQRQNNQKKRNQNVKSSNKK